MVDFSNHDEAQRWFEGQPREVAVAMAARAALRVLPMIVSGQGDLPDARFYDALVLPCFRASAVSWAAIDPTAKEPELRLAAVAARADAIEKAGDLRVRAAAKRVISRAVDADEAAHRSIASAASAAAVKTDTVAGGANAAAAAASAAARAVPERVES
jgi:hypothetical protein